MSRLVCREAPNYDFEPKLIIKVIETESTFRNIDGPTGEAGYMQVLPSTAERYIGFKPSLDWLKTHWKTNIMIGIKELHRMREEHNLLTALGMYNSGPDDGGENLEYLHDFTSRYFNDGDESS